jgi:hypothetical protein
VLPSKYYFNYHPQAIEARLNHISLHESDFLVTSAPTETNTLHLNASEISIEQGYSEWFSKITASTLWELAGLNVK